RNRAEGSLSLDRQRSQTLGLGLDIVPPCGDKPLVVWPPQCGAGHSNSWNRYRYSAFGPSALDSAVSKHLAGPGGRPIGAANRRVASAQCTFKEQQNGSGRRGADCSHDLGVHFVVSLGTRISTSGRGARYAICSAEAIWRVCAGGLKRSACRRFLL